MKTYWVHVISNTSVISGLKSWDIFISAVVINIHLVRADLVVWVFIYWGYSCFKKYLTKELPFLFRPQVFVAQYAISNSREYCLLVKAARPGQGFSDTSWNEFCAFMFSDPEWILVYFVRLSYHLHLFFSLTNLPRLDKPPVRGEFFSALQFFGF